jgi:uroporphyrinogen decarboxylase
MNSRERVLKAINFDYPDRPPISHAILPSAVLRYGDELKAILRDVHEDFGWDILPDLPPEEYPPYYRRGKNYDGFGTLWSSETMGEFGVPLEMPLSDWENYDAYVWPDFPIQPVTARLYSGHMCHPAGEKNPYFYARGGWITFFEQMQQLRGFTQVLLDLAEESREIYRLRDDLLQFHLRQLDKWLAHNYDGIHFADDWGSQNNLFISPEVWRKFFKPVYKAMFEKVTAAGMDVHFHSDGYIVEIIPDLIDLGVKVLNAQVNIMDLDFIQKNFNGKVCFRSDLDRQNVTLFGTPDDVRKHINTVFTHIGSERGGIIACGEIGRDTPLDNIKAMYDTFMSFKF